MVRYLLLKIVVPGAILNFGINFAAGAALFPAGRPMPLWGDRGMAADTVAGAFLVAFITLLLVAPAARREAWSGRVRGWGWRARWLALARRRPALSALIGGVAIAALVGGAAIGAWSARGVAQMDRDAFIWLKASLAVGVGVLAGLVAAFVGIAPEADASADPRWCRAPATDPAAGPSYPCQFLDKGGLAVTDRARGCSATPTWHLVVRGALDPAHVRTALGDVLVRYPSLATRVQALDGAPPYATRFRYAHEPSTTVDDLFAYRDLRGQEPGALAALLREHHDRFCDLFAEPPLTLTLAVTADDACHLIFRQHHAIADGRAFIALLGDFAGYLELARAGQRPAAAALAPVGRRDELEALELTAAQRVGYTVAGVAHVLWSQARAALRPLQPLRQNQSNDYTGDNGTVHWVVGDDALAGWKATGKQLGVSLNSLLTGALFAANQRWHRAQGLPLGRTSATLMMETRPRDPGFVSFANHLASLEVILDLGQEQPAPALARAVQAQVDAQRRRRVPIKRMLGERVFVTALPLDALHKVVFEQKRPARSLDFSNLIALDFPALGGAGWAVDEVFITTPVSPRAGIVLTVIRYRGKVCFNFNYKASAVSRAEVETLAGHFATVLTAR